MVTAAPAAAQDDSYGDPYNYDDGFGDPFERMKKKDRLFKEDGPYTDDKVKNQKPANPYELENSFSSSRPRYKSLSDTVADQLKDKSK
jgi:hypothetical protein